MDLNALRSALAVAEHGGVAAATRATGVPRSTLSRHLAELEQALGLRLVERTSRRFRLTVEGAALVELASKPMATITDIEERMRAADGPLTGRLRVSVPVLFGQSLLGCLAVAFADAHPDVFLDVVVDDRHVDLIREGFDAALRVNPAVDSTLTGRLLGRNRLLLVATPELADRLGYRQGCPEAIVWPAIVRETWGDDGRFDVEQGGRRIVVPAQPRLALSSPLAILDAVLAHAGAALRPQTLVLDPIQRGQLISLGARSGSPEEIWLLHAAGRLPSRRLLAFTDILAPLFTPLPGSENSQSWRLAPS